MPQKRDLSSGMDSDNEPLDQADEARTLSDRVPITRRSCLRSAGVAVASAAAIGGMGSASAKELVEAGDISGTTYEVPGGEFVRILVGENEYGSYGDLTNAVIDAEGKDVEIVAFGSGWEIRNVGVRGPINEGGSAVIDVRADKSGGSGIVENVYLGDGGAGPGIFVDRSHQGEVTIRNAYIAGYVDNGIYASTLGKSSGGGGTVQIENCYAENNNIANYRIGGDGSYIEDSVSVSTDAPDGSGGANLRGVWVRRDDVVVDNVDITTTGTEAIYATGGGTAVYKNSDYEVDYPDDFKGDVETSDLGSNPKTSVPSGVPTSASQAAGGGGSSGGSSDDDESDASEESSSDESEEDSSADEQSTEEESRGGEGEASSEANEETEGDESDDSLPNEVTVRTETGDDVRYEFSVEGEVEALSTGDRTSGDTASGEVHGGRDEYEFSGEFTEFRYSGPIEIDVNGQTVYRDSDN